MRTSIADLLTDLSAEHAATDAMVADLDEADWRTSTPADGWTVADQVGHLAFYDEVATTAMVDRDDFRTVRAALVTAAEQGSRPDVEWDREVLGVEVLDRWRAARAALMTAARAADPKQRVTWFGPSMGLHSFITARLMETWAHGQDIADALGAPPVVTERLRHICHIGVTARPWSFLIHGAQDPGDPVRVQVVSPTGETWSWGPVSADQRIEGTALDLALLVTQRRHLLDTDLKVTGPTAELWTANAQAFAGPVGEGRPPGLGRVSAP